MRPPLPTEGGNHLARRKPELIGRQGRPGAILPQGMKKPGNLLGVEVARQDKPATVQNDLGLADVAATTAFCLHAADVRGQMIPQRRGLICSAKPGLFVFFLRHGATVWGPGGAPWARSWLQGTQRPWGYSLPPRLPWLLKHLQQPGELRPVRRDSHPVGVAQENVCRPLELSHQDFDSALACFLLSLRRWPRACNSGSISS